LVSDLTTEAFIATLRRFNESLLEGESHPSYGSNFIGAKKELDQLVEFLEAQKTQDTIYLSSVPVERFNPEHFGGLWESCVKYHLKRVV
jgi:hypothetical protein